MSTLLLTEVLSWRVPCADGYAFVHEAGALDGFVRTGVGFCLRGGANLEAERRRNIGGTVTDLRRSVKKLYTEC